MTRPHWMLLFASVAAGATLLVACDGSSPPPPRSGRDVQVGDGAGTPPLDHPEVSPSALVRPSHSRRLTIPQLRATLPAVLGTQPDGGALTWMNGSSQGLTQFSGALGEADFLALTEDNLEPSTLYLKFMDDMARDVCNRALTSDRAQPSADRRVLTRYVSATDTVATQPAKIDENLTYLKLRFHGLQVQAPAELDSLRTLFTTVTLAAAKGTAVDANDVQEGWRAVCVALLTAPEFHLY